MASTSTSYSGEPIHAPIEPNAEVVVGFVTSGFAGKHLSYFCAPRKSTRFGVVSENFAQSFYREIGRGHRSEF